jgi:putative sigma-54 modulation protein
MNITIQSIHFHADKKLSDQISRKVSKLGAYFDRITDAEVFLKLENGAHIKDKTVQIKLNLPKVTLVSKETTKHFEESLDLAMDSLKAQLKKHKEKLRK